MKPYKLLPLILMAALVFSACSPTQPPPAPTVDTNMIQQTVAGAQTEAVGTTVAQLQSTNSNTSAAAPTEAPTYTPYPTYTAYPTYTPAAAIFTPQPQATQQPTLKATSAGVTTVLTAAPKAYSCEITNSTIPIGKQMSTGYDFDAKFTLKNTGTQDWGAPDFDIVYVSGEKSMVKKDRYDLPATVKTGDTIDITLDLVAPSTPGSYTVEYMLSGGTTFCPMDVSINAK